MPDLLQLLGGVAIIVGFWLLAGTGVALLVGGALAVVCGFLWEDRRSQGTDWARNRPL